MAAVGTLLLEDGPDGSVSLDPVAAGVCLAAGAVVLAAALARRRE